MLFRSTGEENVSYGDIDERLRRAQVRLRAERGGGGLLQSWAIETRAVEERLEAAVRQEMEQSARLEKVLALEKAIAGAEAASVEARMRRERLEIADTAAQSARVACQEAERAEQVLLEEMALWEKGWEQEGSLRDDAVFEAAARQERLEREIAHWQSIRTDALAEADRTGSAGRPQGDRRTFVLGLSGIAGFLLIGLLLGILVDPALFAVAAAAFVPAAVTVAGATARRREAVALAGHQAAVLMSS